MIKSIINERFPAKPKGFPRLMVGTLTGNIYLVTHIGGMYTDTTLELGPNHDGSRIVGERYSSRHLSRHMVDFEGTITLSNE
jgi:hypothetical protein